MTVLYSDAKTITVIPTLKDPSATKSYGFDWVSWMAAGDTIASSVWVVDSGLTNEADDNDTTQTSIKLSGGTDGTTYTVTNTITTATDAEIEPRSFTLTCGQT